MLKAENSRSRWIIAAFLLQVGFVPSAQQPPGPAVSQGTPQLRSPRGDLAVKLMRFEDQCLPAPDLAEIEKDFALSESTLVEANAVIDGAPDPCEASAEVYLFLMAQKGEWSPGKMFQTVWEIHGYDGKDFAENMASLFSKSAASAISKCSSVVNAAQWGDVILKESATARMRERFIEALELYRQTRGWDAARYSAQVNQINSEIAAIERRRREIPGDLMMAVDKIPRPQRPREDAPEVWDNYDGQVENLYLRARDDEAKLISRLLTENLLKRTLQDFREPMLGKTCDQRISELGPGCPKKPAAIPAPPRTAPRHFDQLTEAEKKALFDCLCKCVGGYAAGTYVAYNPQPAGPAGTTCGEPRYGQCVYSGAGCWRDYLRADTPAAEICMQTADVEPASTRDALARMKAQSLDSLWDEAVRVGFFPSMSSPEPVYSRLKRYVDEDMSGRALALAEQVARIDPGRKAKADQVKVELGRNMPAWAPDLIRELDFARAETLLGRAIRLGDPTGVGKKNLGDVARWKKDWDGIQAGAQRADALLSENKVCEAWDLYVKQIQTLVNDFNLVAPQKDRLYRELGERLDRARSRCIDEDKISGIPGRIEQAQQAHDARAVAEACEKALSRPALCDCRRTVYEKLLAQARAEVQTQQNAASARAQTLVDQGKAQEARGDLAGAIQSYDGARKIRPSPEIDRHIQDLQAALARKKQEEDRRAAAAAWVNQGQIRERASNYPAAIDCYQRALQIMPNPEVEARIRYLQDQMRQAAKPPAAGPQGASKAEQVQSIINRGNQLASQGNYNGAIDAFNQAIAMDPGNEAAHMHRGGAKFNQGNYQGAAADFSRAVAINPRNPINYNNRGSARDKLGDHAGAQADYRKALELDPNNQLARNNLNASRAITIGGQIPAQPATPSAPPKTGAFRASGEWPVEQGGEKANAKGDLSVTGTQVSGKIELFWKDPSGGNTSERLEMPLTGTFDPATGHFQGTLAERIGGQWTDGNRTGDAGLNQKGTWSADLRGGEITGTIRGTFYTDTAHPYEFPIRMHLE